MKENPDIYLLLADTGYGIMDDIRKDFPERSVNFGASENLMLGAAIGLANSGKIPVCYTITPFLLYTGFEFIRNYIHNENTKVILVGSGRDKDYSRDGFSHWSEDDHKIIKNFENILTVYPDTKESIYFILKRAIEVNQPTYINLRR